MDTLQGKGLIRREQIGKSVTIHPTSAGLAQREAIQDATQKLMEVFEESIGMDVATDLAQRLNQASYAFDNLNT